MAMCDERRGEGQDVVGPIVVEVPEGHAHPPNLAAVQGRLELPAWVITAMVAKWEAGAKEHEGGEGDFRQPGFDFYTAIAGEALDIVNYYAEARERGVADSRLECAALRAGRTLKMLGEEAAMAAAGMDEGEQGGDDDGSAGSVEQ